MSEYNSKIIRKRLRFLGSVQGVGFRYMARYAAKSVGATGWVRNDPDGAVSMEIQCTEADIDRVIETVREGTFVDIQSIEAEIIPLIEHERGFRTRGYW